MPLAPLIDIADRHSTKLAIGPVGTQPSVIASYTAGEVLGVGLVVKFGATDNVVVQADAETDLLIGIYAGDRAAVAGEAVPVVLLGLTTGIAGDTVTRGQLLTAETTTARLVPAGADESVIAVALASAVDGGVVPVLVVPSLNATPA
jgi:hypothetical protein